MIGHFLAKNFRDASDFCVMLDTMFLLIFIWDAYIKEGDATFDERVDFSRAQGISAIIGLPAGLLTKFESHNRRAVFASAFIAGAAAVSFANSIVADFRLMHAFREEIEMGQMTVDWLFWPLQWMSVLILLVLTLNHLLLAGFSWGRVSALKAGGAHRPVEDPDLPTI